MIHTNCASTSELSGFHDGISEINSLALKTDFAAICKCAAQSFVSAAWTGAPRSRPGSLRPNVPIRRFCGFGGLFTQTWLTGLCEHTDEAGISLLKPSASPARGRVAAWAQFTLVPL